MERDHTNARQNASRSWWLGHRRTIHNRHTRSHLIDFPRCDDSHLGSFDVRRRSRDVDSSSNRAAPDRESQAHADEIWSARFDPSGQRIVSASRDHTSRILQIDPTTLAFNEIARLRNAEDQGTKLNEGTAFLAMSVAIDRAHRRLYVGSADSIVRVWDLDLATELAPRDRDGTEQHVGAV